MFWDMTQCHQACSFQCFKRITLPSSSVHQELHVTQHHYTEDMNLLKRVVSKYTPMNCVTALCPLPKSQFGLKHICDCLCQYHHTGDITSWQIGIKTFETHITVKRLTAKKD